MKPLLSNTVVSSNITFVEDNINDLDNDKNFLSNIKNLGLYQYNKTEPYKSKCKWPTHKNSCKMQVPSKHKCNKEKAHIKLLLQFSSNWARWVGGKMATVLD